MELAVRSESFCMIWEGFAKAPARSAGGSPAPRDEHIASDPEAQVGRKIAEGLNELALVAIGVKDAGFSMGVGG
jgi:hypothetical protein